MKSFTARFIIAAAAIATSESAMAQTTIPLIDIRAVDPTIVVDLRYAAANNFSRRPLYAAGTVALIRPEVAPRLAAAQAFLRRYQYQLKIWDAYRPKSVQRRLWQRTHNTNYVADPGTGPGSMHSWGIAVDATLTDALNNPVNMPSDFDDFTPAAMLHYQGIDPAVRAHLRLLQLAMADSGFLGMRTEWWHFTVADWQKYVPREEVKRGAHGFEARWQAKL
jgi:D-alanyl-D-alanine dipeptidase